MRIQYYFHDCFPKRQPMVIMQPAVTKGWWVGKCAICKDKLYVTDEGLEELKKEREKGWLRHGGDTQGSHKT